MLKNEPGEAGRRRRKSSAAERRVKKHAGSLFDCNDAARDWRARRWRCRARGVGVIGGRVGCTGGAREGGGFGLCSHRALAGEECVHDVRDGCCCRAKGRKKKDRYKISVLHSHQLTHKIAFEHSGEICRLSDQYQQNAAPVGTKAAQSPGPKGERGQRLASGLKMSYVPLTCSRLPVSRRVWRTRAESRSLCLRSLRKQPF